MRPRTKTTPEAKLSCFDWLPLEQWTADRLLSAPDPRVEHKCYCKVCDEWVEPTDVDNHAKHHRKEWEKHKQRRADAAKKARLDAARLARAEKRRLKGGT